MAPTQDPQITIIEHINCGSIERALRLCRRALIRAPKRFELLYLLGICLQHLGRSNDALDAYLLALRQHTFHLDTMCRIAALLHSAGRIDEALEYIERALTCDPTYFPAMMQRADLQISQGKPEDALITYEQIIKVHPDQSASRYNRSLLLAELHRLDEARSSLEQLVVCDPCFAAAHAELGLIHAKLGRNDSALRELGNALALAPNHFPARKNRAVLLYELGRPLDSLTDFEYLCRHEPSDLSAHCGCGAAQFALGQLESARARYEHVLRIAPNNSDANWNLSLIHLTEGRLSAGWERYDWRWRTKLAWPQRHPAEPAWNGEYVDGTLLLWGEQGVGDEIFFAGMINDATARADTLVVETDPRLVPLFERSFPNVRPIARGTPLPESVRCRLPIGSVGRFLRRRWPDVPATRAGYLKADPTMISKLEERLSANTARRFRVGLSWRSLRTPLASAKSLSLESLSSLLCVPGIHFVDLQYGDSSADLRLIEERLGTKITHLSDIDSTNDLDKLSALICACDIVVTTSNATAHLAAALGRTVHVLVPFAQGSLWYWHRDRMDSPWYPTVKIHRQSSDGSWNYAVDQITTQIRHLTGVDQ